jgi:hypothetical protein
MVLELRMKNFPLCISASHPFALFRAANTAPARPAALRGEVPRRPEPDEGRELQEILDKFGITDPAIGAQSAFGKVYRGTYGGVPVAVKIEKKGNGSEEFEVLRHIQQLRDGAPQGVRTHLPVIFAIDGVGSFNYYVMELLVPAPEDVLRDVFGSGYGPNPEYRNWNTPPLERREGESEDEYAARLEQHKDDHMRAAVSEIGGDPAELNMEPGMVLFHSSRDRWSDQELINAAFDTWYYRRAGIFLEVAGDPGADDSEFRNKIKSLISSAIWKRLGLGGRVGGEVSIPADRLAADIRAEVAAELGKDPWVKVGNAPWVEVWEKLAGALPELLFAISRASWLAVWHPDNPRGSEYSKLRRSHGSGNLQYRQNLQSTLDWLASHGLAWGDVHSGNIMMRPGTRELVFIDFGLYSFITRS